MRKILLIFLLIFFFTLPVFAQQVDTAWVRRYNGPGNGSDYAQAIAVDRSGNVCVTGSSYSVGTGLDYATIKYLPNGDTAWARRYNGPGNGRDSALAVAVDNVCNVYVTGTSFGAGTGEDYTTIKYYPNGDTAWLRRYNGPGNSYDRAQALSVDDSGNVYVTGGSGSSSDYTTIKYTSSGEVVWIARYNGPGNAYDMAFAIFVDDFDNVYITGDSYAGWGSGADDFATIKYLPNGDTAWVRRYNRSNYDVGFDLVVDSSCNVYVTGFSDGGYSTIKYDSSGRELWVSVYGANVNFVDYDGNTLTPDSHGNVYVTGWRTDGSGNYIGDFATIKYGPDGSELWVKTYNGQANQHDRSYDIAKDSYGSVYVTGTSLSETSFDYATIKYYANGDTAWLRRYNGPGNSDDKAIAIAVDDVGNVYVTGTSFGAGTGEDYATIKYAQEFPPNFFSLLSPFDSSIIPYVITFNWETALDPNPSDTVIYDLYVSTSLGFHPDSTIIYDSLLISQYTDTLNMGSYYWKVKAYNKHSGTWSTQTWTFLSALRGDADGDRQVDVSDVVYLINFLFKGGPTPVPELLIADVDCFDSVNIVDIVYLINYLFRGGSPPGC